MDLLVRAADAVHQSIFRLLSWDALVWLNNRLWDLRCDLEIEMDRREGKG